MSNLRDTKLNWEHTEVAFLPTTKSNKAPFVRTKTDIQVGDSISDHSRYYTFLRSQHNTGLGGDEQISMHLRFTFRLNLAGLVPEFSHRVSSCRSFCCDFFIFNMYQAWLACFAVTLGAPVRVPIKTELPMHSA